MCFFEKGDRGAVEKIGLLYLILVGVSGFER